MQVDELIKGKVYTDVESPTTKWVFEFDRIEDDKAYDARSIYVDKGEVMYSYPPLPSSLPLFHAILKSKCWRKHAKTSK